MYRSVDDFTSSCFQRPHISDRVVDAKKHMFTQSSNPIGPKKYTNISMSPKNQMLNVTNEHTHQNQTEPYRSKYALSIHVLLHNTHQQTSMWFHRIAVSISAVHRVCCPWWPQSWWWVMESPMHRSYKFVNEFSPAFCPMLLAENHCVISKKKKKKKTQNKIGILINKRRNEKKFLFLNVIGNLIHLDNWRKVYFIVLSAI